jgi:hypothetical protein
MYLQVKTSGIIKENINTPKIYKTQTAPGWDNAAVSNRQNDSFFLLRTLKSGWEAIAMRKQLGIITLDGLDFKIPDQSTPSFISRKAKTLDYLGSTFHVIGDCKQVLDRIN